MPAGKPRRKDDTWTTEDLTHALKGAKDGGDKKKRSKDDDGKERRRAKDDVNGDDKKSRKKEKDDEDHRGKGRSRGDFSPAGVDLTEEDRDRLRQERREKRGGDSKKKEDRPRKEEKEAEERPRREESARRHRKRDDEDDGDKKRRHGDDDGDRKRHRDKESKHRDKEDEDDEDRERRRRERRERREKKDEDGDQKPDDDDERERRRQERREKKDKDGDRERKHKSKRDHHDDDDDKEKKHRDREERHRDKEERHKDRDKDRDREKEREERRKDKEDRHKDKKDKDKESREDRKRREREEERQQKEEEEKRKKEAEKGGGDDDDYNNYEDDDFEDYEDDFEGDDMNELSPQISPREKTRTLKFVVEPNTTEGEMEEVLRALDEENARLTSLSQRSNWSDSTELSDERFKEGEGPGQDGGGGGGGGEGKGGDSRPARPKTFINFVSAKQRVMNQSQASKARRRADDLKNMIELDTVFYDLFDLPPVREYDLYIRSFGRSNTKQAYVQTNEDAVERDIQTEETEDMDKWTQHPAEDMGGVGGDGISVKSGEEDKMSLLSNAETSGRIGKFLERAAEVMVVLMEEEKNIDEGGGQARERTSNISVSEGFSQLGCPSYLAGRRVDQVCFCPLQPNMFLTLHSRPQENAPENVMGGYGIICVWNVKETASPQKVLTSLSQPTCACFSPSRAALVIAGMHDGSVMVWDLREPSSLHRSVCVEDQEITTRFPTYNTAGVLDKENHHSPVTAITAVHPAVLRRKPEESVSAESEGSLSFQLASVEEAATVNLWVVTEISSPDMAGSEVDLGLAPGGRVKLLRSSAIVLDNPNKLVSSGTLKALDIQLSPSDLNHFFVATDLGQIIHGVRFGSRVFPRAFHPEIDAPKQITCLDFSPFGEPYFLAGCEDGSVHLYHTSQKHPLSSWPLFSEGHSIMSVLWSRSRPAVFLVLAENSTLYTFDLVETGLLPIKSDPIASGRITAMAMASDPALIGGNKSLPAHLLVALDNGCTELHTISNVLRQQQPLECDFLAHYTDRF